MQNKIAKWLVFMVGAGCLYIFLAIRIEPLFNVILKEKIVPEYWENTKYGELYYYNNFIKHFREKNLPPAIPKYRNTKKHPKLNEAEILTFGDSFFDFSRMVTFPERIADTLHKKVYYRRMLEDHRPVIYLKQDNYADTNPKILLYETSERFLAFRFLNRHDTIPPVDNRIKFRKTAAAVWNWVFIEERELKYNVLLQRNMLTAGLYSDIATLKFDAFNYITESTPIYSLKNDEPWLFYMDEVNDDNSSFYYKFTDEEIYQICDNIADVAGVVKRKYNLQFIFMPIPSKYAIYHTMVNNDEYSNFLPRLYEGLDKRGIPVVKLYDKFINSKEILYYGTDNHWNKKGLDIAVSEALEVMKPYLNSNYLAQDSLSTKTKTIQ